jgi:7-alpha-hydroxysteroid dehydrogenase
MMAAMTLLDHFRLDGKVAIVTGASRGIGAACAVGLAECGADVVIAARSKDTLADVTKQIEALGRRVVAVACNLDKLDNMQALVDAATGELGGLDIVINNVGGTMPQPFMDTTTKAMEDAFHFNVSTAFHLTKLAAPAMLAGDGGSIVNITSVIGKLSDRGYAAYGTAKAAMSHLTELLAADLAPRIRVNGLAPGAIETDALGMVLNDELEALMVGGTPMRRLGRVEDIALGVLYLASPASSYVTGKILAVDGGLTFPNLSLGLPDL